MMMSGPSGDPIKIGTVLDFTGDLGAYASRCETALT